MMKNIREEIDPYRFFTAKEREKFSKFSIAEHIAEHMFHYGNALRFIVETINREIKNGKY